MKQPGEVFISAYSAVRDGGAGLIDLASRGRILVSGSEAAMFLNGLITNDVNTLSVNSWMPAVFANVQGRLLAAVRVIHLEDGFLIDTESTTHETVVKLLERYTMAGDFRVTDLTAGMMSYSVQGKRSAEVINTALGEHAERVEKGKVVSGKIGDGDNASVIRATHTSEDGFDLFVKQAIAQQLCDQLTASGTRLVGDEVAETLRIEAGLPRYGVDMDETNVVTETNLDDAVSFTKGCYTGQEIIVRIKHRGHVAKKLTGLLIQGQAPIGRGAKILSPDGNEVGRVTSSTFSPALERPVALGYVKYDYLLPGTKVRTVTGDEEREGEIVELPFIRGSWYE